MTTYESVELEVKKLIKEKLRLRVEVDQVEDSLAFGTGSGFDSTTLMELIVQLEEKYNVVVPDEDLVLDNFGSVSGISRYLSKIIESK